MEAFMPPVCVCVCVWYMCVKERARQRGSSLELCIWRYSVTFIPLVYTIYYIVTYILYIYIYIL